MPPRSVSGSIKKLINEGYCEKLNTNPVTYKITTLGKDIQLD
jgi:predicted transcriptional regulator